jgi:hypothetical protein
VTHFLVVAHQTAAGDLLARRLRELNADVLDATFTVLVPATHPKHLFGRIEGERLFTYTQEEWEETARERGEEAVRRLRSEGLRVDEVIIGDESPVIAIEDELRRYPDRFDVVVISTLAPGVSRWLRMGAIEQARKRVSIPVLPVYEGGDAEWHDAIREWRMPSYLRRQQDPQSRFGWLPRIQVWHIVALVAVYLTIMTTLAFTADRGFLRNDVIALTFFGLILAWHVISERPSRSRRR